MLPTLANPDATFALMLATLRWPDDDRRRTAIAAAASAPIDWDRFLALAARHRVTPLAVQGIAVTTLEIPERIAQLARETHARAVFAELGMAAELSRLRSLLTRHDIKCIALKGPTQSLRSFGRLGLRINRDLDILVPFERIEEVERILTEAGYAYSEPSSPPSVAQRDQWLRDHKDMVFITPNRSATIEIHWRLFDNLALMPLALLPEPVRLGIAPLEDHLVLQDDSNLLYLCRHGAQHGWSRLKWLADVNALLASCDDDGQIRRICQARGSGPDAAVGQALILCNRLFGTSLPAQVEHGLARSARAKWLARIAWRQILRSDVDELEARRFGSTIKNLSHYALHGGGPYWLEELRFDLTVSPRNRPPEDDVTGRGRLRGWFHRHFSPQW